MDHIVKLLLSNGADANIEHIDDNASHRAVRYGHLNTANMLLKHGTSTNSKNKRGKTPLQLAQDYGRKDIARLL